MKKCEFEFQLNTSPKVLFPMLSTPSGLAEWFADNVNLKGNKYVFKWNDVIDRASVLMQKENSYIRFKWDADVDEKSYFEFKIIKDEMTKDVSLIVTDFTEDEEEDLKELWESQILKLRHFLGL